MSKGPLKPVVSPGNGELWVEAVLAASVMLQDAEGLEACSPVLDKTMNPLTAGHLDTATL